MSSSDLALMWTPPVSEKTELTRTLALCKSLLWGLNQCFGSIIDFALVRTRIEPVVFQCRKDFRGKPSIFARKFNAKTREILPRTLPYLGFWCRQTLKFLQKVVFSLNQWTYHHYHDRWYDISSYRTGPPGYIGWRNQFLLGIDSWAHLKFRNTVSDSACFM